MKNIIGAKPGPEAAEVRFLTVDEESAGQRLDNFLFRHLKGVPKTHVYRIIRSGEVRINKGRAQAETRIEMGDVLRLPPVRISPRAEEGATPPAPAREFPVLLEDDAVLAIDKPAGVAVHGGSGVSFGVIEQLRTARPGAKFLELVHRLDRETSGILLVAKDHPDAMHAVTLGRVLASIAMPGDAAPASLLALTIKTGRTHQIRVHLASAGHAIAGDDKYGDFERNRQLQKRGLKRMFLHAWRLQFNHPALGQRMALQADLPPELLAFLPPEALASLATPLSPASP